MKLIHNMVTIPVNDDKFIVINTLNGLIDEVNRDNHDILQGWSSIEQIVPTNEIESELFVNLKNRGYLVIDDAEEARIKDDIYVKLREKNQKMKEYRGTITFILTYDCNFGCPYCFEAKNASSSGIITKQMVDAALSMTDETLKMIRLFGGEPLLPRNRNIIEYIFSKRKDVLYRIITNGYYLDEYLDLLIKMNISAIQVTLDGAKSTHDSLRCLANGGPTYDKIISGMKKCLENKIIVRVRMNLNNDNYDECIKLRQYLSTNMPNADKYLFFEIQPIFQTEKKGRYEILEQLYMLDADKSEEEIAVSNRTLNLSVPVIQYFLHKKKILPLYSFCYGHNNSLMFDPFGDIYPCLVSVGRKPLSTGTYFPKIEFYDKSLYTRNIESIKECNECRYAFLCGGGCAVGLEDHSNLNKPNCRAMHDMNKLVPILYERKFTKVHDIEHTPSTVEL